MTTSEIPLVTITEYFTAPSGKRNFTPRSEEKLAGIEMELMRSHGLTLPGYIQMRFKEGQFAKELSDEFSMDRHTLRRLCGIIGIQIRGKSESQRLLWSRGIMDIEANRARMIRQNQDPDFRAKALEASRKTGDRLRNDPQSAETMRLRSLKKWQDPAFRRNISQVARKTMARNMKDPNYREKQAASAREGAKRRWADPVIRAETSRKLSETFKRKMFDPEYAQVWEEITKKAHRRWEDPQHRQRMARLAFERWQDDAWRKDTITKIIEGLARPKIREKLRQSSISMWEDPETRALLTRRSQERWRDPEFRDKMMKVIKPPTIQGTRRDIDFVAISTWEANIARVLRFVDRSFDVHQHLGLIVPEEYKDRITGDTTTLDIDFWTMNKRAHLVLYEIMAHPKEDPLGWAKLELAMQQYPGLDIRVISEKFYSKIKRHFANRINSDSRFCGWETGDSNLYTNREKYGL